MPYLDKLLPKICALVRTEINVKEKISIYTNCVTSIS
jgi:hypothetical protein